jgi:RNA-directed DNA polymerase
MEQWRPQRYRVIGETRGIAPQVLGNAVTVGELIVAVDPELPPVFTLKHLAYLTGSDYGFLRGVVARRHQRPYTTFSVRKAGRPASHPEFRVICVPCEPLLKVQRWIARRILSCGRPHTASTAYATGCNVRDAAEVHCECRWLIKLDVRRFFESISEIMAARVFEGLGYRPLVAFELARICTRLGARVRGDSARWRANWQRYGAIKTYGRREQPGIGHLPQGAPTSPMLANLAVVSFDEDVTAIAADTGLVYTRYADDLFLSTRGEFSRERAAGVIGRVYEAMGKVGLSPNIAKTRVSPPGARKIVLGLGVETDRPTLSSAFRDGLRQHLHYMTRAEVGPARHAARRGFASVVGLRHHIQGLVAFARQIDEPFGDAMRSELESVAWPR